MLSSSLASLSAEGESCLVSDDLLLETNNFRPPDKGTNISVIESHRSMSGKPSAFMTWYNDIMSDSVVDELVTRCFSHIVEIGTIVFGPQIAMKPALILQLVILSPA